MFAKLKLSILWKGLEERLSNDDKNEEIDDVGILRGI